jgi:L-asparaginase/Glu-tRNA(Gln) amidotransferase subunit D
MPQHEAPPAFGKDAAWEKAMKIVYLITTGGTIEKTYSEEKGEVSNSTRKIERYLRLLRLGILEELSGVREFAMEATTMEFG